MVPLYSNKLTLVVLVLVYLNVNKITKDVKSFLDYKILQTIIDCNKVDLIFITLRELSIPSQYPIFN